MRRTLLSLLTAANLLAGAALLTVAATPAAAEEEGGGRDCCQTSVEGTGFCCDNCCWFTSDCNSSSQCPDREAT